MDLLVKLDILTDGFIIVCQQSNDASLKFVTLAIQLRNRENFAAIVGIVYESRENLLLL